MLGIRDLPWEAVQIQQCLHDHVDRGTWTSSQRVFLYILVSLGVSKERGVRQSTK